MVLFTTIKDRLLNSYSKYNKYVENVHYKKIRSGKYVNYYINFPTFERISTESQSKKSELIKTYFIKLHQFIYGNTNIAIEHT